jgi:hypothetical protein
MLCCAQALQALLGDGFAGVSWGLQSKHAELKVRLCHWKPHPQTHSQLLAECCPRTGHHRNHSMDGLM